MHRTYPLNNNVETVTLTVSDTNGCVNSITKPIYLFEPVVNVDQETFTCFGDTVQLSAYSNMLYTYQWNMGDGTTYSTQFINHVYQNPGFYNVTLEVFDAQNCSKFIDVDSIEVFQPISTFTPNTPQSICVGELFILQLIILMQVTIVGIFILFNLIKGIINQNLCFLILVGFLM